MGWRCIQSQIKHCLRREPPRMKNLCLLGICLAGGLTSASSLQPYWSVILLWELSWKHYRKHVYLRSALLYQSQTAGTKALSTMPDPHNSISYRKGNGCTNKISVLSPKSFEAESNTARPTEFPQRPFRDIDLEKFCTDLDVQLKCADRRRDSHTHLHNCQRWNEKRDQGHSIWIFFFTYQ